MKNPKMLTKIFACFLILGMISCESFVEIDPPNNTIITESIFESDATIESALANIYYKMREGGMVSGNFGLSIALGIYTDELEYYGNNNNQLNLYNHNVFANDITISSWWNHAYNIIYASNDIIEGIDNSTTLLPETKAQYKGQAFFVRAYMHSLLVALFGDIPYVSTTDHASNSKEIRMPVQKVYEHIIADLNNAITFLDSSDASKERVIPNQSAANALLSRMYLYTQKWEKAEETSSKLISTFTLETDVQKVFLKHASETIWQFKPEGKNIKNTQEGQILVINFVPTQGYGLSDSLLTAFETGDLRATNWINSITSTDGLTTIYYPYKYKETINTTANSLEYSIIFRLAEQYLIRAEARAHLGAISDAQNDLNTIRNRAGLNDIATTDAMALIDAIHQERRVELFTEHGHRWFDLNRIGRADEALRAIKPNWRLTNVLLPIPETELRLNPNLKPQNSGY